MTEAPLQVNDSSQVEPFAPPQQEVKAALPPVSMPITSARVYGFVKRMVLVGSLRQIVDCYNVR